MYFFHKTTHWCLLMIHSRYELHLNFDWQNTQTCLTPWPALTKKQLRGRRSSHPKQLQLSASSSLPSSSAGTRCCWALILSKRWFLALKARLPSCVPGQSHTELSCVTLPSDRVAMLIYPSGEFSLEVRSGFVVSWMNLNPGWDLI